MDTKTLIAEAKARFNHNSAKAQLKDKYESKLIIADQGGLWKADAETITFLSAFDSEKLILIDRFDNTVEVDRQQLLSTLKTIYTNVMGDWYKEWKDAETKR